MIDELECLKDAKNIAILGGTFDPIHNGHISVAKEILKKTSIEKILFIPNGLPPHKNVDEVTPANIRLEMTRAAVAKEEDMLVSSIEVKRQGLTYTVETISELKSILGNNVSLKFITGADAIFYISSWKDYKKLLEICSFIAVARPGYNKNMLISQINTMESMGQYDIEFIEIEPVDVSSSKIRDLVKEGESIENLVPDEVAKYIYENNLYR